MLKINLSREVGRQSGRLDGPFQPTGLLAQKRHKRSLPLSKKSIFCIVANTSSETRKEFGSFAGQSAPKKLATFSDLNRPNGIEMNDNPLILGTVKSLTENFFIRNEDGSTSPDHETREIVKRKFEHLRVFLHSNGLLETSIIDDDGNLIDKPLRKADLTDQGLNLLRKKMAAWLDSRASDANPPKLTMLEKTLTEIRK